MNTVSDDESEGEDAVTREKSKHSLINESTGTGTSPMQTPGRWDREQINFGSYSFINTGRHSPWFSRASLGDSARAFHFNLILSSNWSNYSNHSLFYWKLRYPRGGGALYLELLFTKQKSHDGSEILKMIGNDCLLIETNANVLLRESLQADETFKSPEAEKLRKCRLIRTLLIWPSRKPFIKFCTQTWISSVNWVVLECLDFWWEQPQ